MACIICGEAMSPWLQSPLDPKKNERHRHSSFSFCNGCELGSMAKLPSPEEVPGFYKLKTYYTQNASHIKDVAPSFADRVLTKLAYLADYGEPRLPSDFRTYVPGSAKALDVGSGGGEKLRQYKEIGWASYGLEPDPAAVSRTATDDIAVYQGTAECLPAEISQERFDFISMTHVLEHCINPKLAIENIFSLLAPGGVFWCEVPNCGCAHFQKYNTCSEMFDAPRHIHFFNDLSLRKLLVDQGFEIQETYYHGFVRHHLRSWREWEREVYEMTRETNVQMTCPEHTYLSSLALLAQSAFAKPAKKYDCIGVVVRKPS